MWAWKTCRKERFGNGNAPIFCAICSWKKCFREKGLVTRATNTKRMLRTQQVALYGFGFAALAIFCVLAWFAMGSLSNGVKDQGDYWHVVSTAGWENNLWKESIVHTRARWFFRISDFHEPCEGGQQMDHAG